MSRRILCQKIGGAGGFLDLPFEFHISAWDGINVDGGGNFTSLTDLTGNGYTFLPEPDTLGTSPIEIVPSGIGGKQALRFDGTNQIYNLPAWLGSQREIFLFIVFKIENTNLGGNPGRIFSVENTRLSEGNRYGIINNSSITSGWSTGATNINSSKTYLGNHYGFLNTSGEGGTLQFALDNETVLTTSIGVVAPGYNNSYCAIGGNRNRYSRMLFCEARAMLGNYDLITPAVLSDMAAYVSATYGL